MIDSKSSHIQESGSDITIYRTPANYTGKAMVGRVGKLVTDYAVQYKRQIIALLTSSLTTGELLSANGEKLLCVVAKNQIIEGQAIAIQAYGLVCNDTVTITRDTATYNNDGNVTGTTTQTLVNEADCHVEIVNSRMRLEDPGLLDSTLFKVYAVNNSSVQQLDKVTINAEVYRVDLIDRFQIPGVMVLQLGRWAG